jgi:hypothetical protein
VKLLGPAQNSLVPPCHTHHHGSINQKTYCHQIPQKLIPLITGEPDFSVVRLPTTFSGRAHGHIWCCLGLRLCQSHLLYNVCSLCPSFNCYFISGSSDLIYLAIHVCVCVCVNRPPWPWGLLDDTYKRQKENGRKLLHSLSTRQHHIGHIMCLLNLYTTIWSTSFVHLSEPWITAIILVSGRAIQKWENTLILLIHS